MLHGCDYSAVLVGAVMGGLVACGVSTVPRSLRGQEEESGDVKNSLGRRRVVPYTISAAVQDGPSFSVVRIPRSTSGSVSINVEGFFCAFKAAFN